MIQFIAVGLLGAAALRLLLKDEKPRRRAPSAPLTTLDRNLLRLTRLLQDPPHPRAAFVGQPGAGKSSLVLALTEGKSHPLPRIGVETDATDWSSDLDAPLLTKYKGKVLVDAPGWDTKNHPVKSFQRYFPFQQFRTVVLVFSGKLHEADEVAHRRMTESGGSGQRVLVRTFSEHLSVADRQAVESDIAKRLGRVSLLFVSNRTGEGISELKRVIDI